MFTRDVPLFAVRAAVLESAALAEHAEDDRRRAREEDGGERGAGARSRAADREPRLALRREDVSAQEFDLAGVGSAGQGFVAFAYSPTGQLNAYAPGERIADAIVRSVDADQLVLETEEGPLRVPLAPLQR